MEGGAWQMTDDGKNIMPIGKYKGRLIEELLVDDPGYLQWLAGKDWFSRQVRHAAPSHHQSRRRAGRNAGAQRAASQIPR
jgi:hypothetical protein